MFLRLLESSALLILRVALGGLMAYAGFMKLLEPQQFAFALKGYDVFDPQTHGYLLVLAAFVVPWLELISGLLLAVGLWTRASATTIFALLLTFTLVLVSVLMRDMDLECTCFGKADVICSGAIGGCHIWRNSVLMLVSLLILWRGAGLLSLDHPLLSRRLKLAKCDLLESEPKSDPE